jgi:hypothetical protein
MPDQDAVLAITAEAFDMQNEIDLIWQYLFPALKKEKLAENSALAATLNKRLSSLSLPLPATTDASETSSQISGKTYAFETNDKHLQSMSFQLKENVCQVAMKIDTATYNFSLGSGKWIEGTTLMLGPSLFLQAKAHYAGFPADKVVGSYGWKDQNTLELLIRYIETPHTETINCKFDKNKITVEFAYSNMPGSVQPKIIGAIKE